LGLIESFSVLGEANFTFCSHDSEEVGPAGRNPLEAACLQDAQ